MGFETSDHANDNESTYEGAGIPQQPFDLTRDLTNRLIGSDDALRGQQSDLENLHPTGNVGNYVYGPLESADPTGIMTRLLDGAAQERHDTNGTGAGLSEYLLRFRTDAGAADETRQQHDQTGE